MHMNGFGFFLLIIIAVILFFIFRKKGHEDDFEDQEESHYYEEEEEQEEYLPIRVKDYFFTRNEYKLYKILYSIINEKPDYELVSKVRWEDIWNVQKGAYQYKRYRGYLRSRHIDFVILSREQGCAIKILIELNDSSHNYYQTIERDERLKKFCEYTELHLMIIKTSRFYDEEKIKENLNKCIQSKEVFICEC